MLRCYLAGLVLLPCLTWADDEIGRTTNAKSTMRVLCFSATGWYRHPEIPAINGWLARTCAKHGINIDISESAKDIHDRNLAKYDVIILNNAKDAGPALEAELAEHCKTALARYA